MVTNSSKQTLFLDVGSIKELVKKVGISNLIKETASAMEEDFTNWKSFQLANRVAHHSKLGVIEVMPIANDYQYSFKYVNGHPQNPSKGFGTVLAFGALADFTTGFPLFLSEMTFLTAVRTAVASCCAAKHLVPDNSSSMAMIGNGAQAEFQILAFYHLLGIKKIKLYDIDKKATSKVIKNLSSSKDLELIVCNSINEAIQDVEIITTCTADKARATILTNDMIRPGIHINAIGGDCPGKTELSSEILNRSKVFVEHAPQSRIEGEIQQMQNSFKVTELWELFTGLSKGRTSKNDITIFDSVGFALEDFSALRVSYDLAKKHQVGKMIDLVAIPHDVKDLYSFFQ